MGNNGTITSKSKDKNNGKLYEIGVDIQLSANGLTKIIKLTPYYILINHTRVIFILHPNLIFLLQNLVLPQF